MAYSLYTLEHSNGDKPFLLQLENDGIMLKSKNYGFLPHSYWIRIWKTNLTPKSFVRKQDIV